MPTTRYRRQFAAGSRPAPDPYDQFLDLEGFYRKHTARDASCLFRSVAEQLYDSQTYHQQIRKDCVNFLIKHRDQYERETPSNFDDYVAHMAKSTTYGTFLELKALGYMFKRNVLLYQPYDLGKWLVEEDGYTETLRIFFAPEKHFDAVYTKPVIVKAAYCQSLLYEMLYKNVFKLPDVEYSVEAMLHGITDGYSTEEYGHNHIVLDDGRTFQLDEPEETSCILDNAMLCHFHNPDFEVIADQADRCTNKNDSINVQRMLSASLPDKLKSCVRQLLDQGITPFPYKVAKALDPDIYRNIAFDSWSDARKELNSPERDDELKVGSKCWLKSNGTGDTPLKCHIREIDSKKKSCVVYIEEIGEKRSVERSSLQPMNGSKWLMTQHVQRSRYDMSSDFNRKFDLQQFCQFDKKTLAPKQHGKLVGNRSKSSSHRNVIENFVDIHSLTDMSNFQPEGLELMAMPINAYYRSSNHSGGNQNPNNQKPLATQPPKNVRNGPQAPPKQPDQPIQLLKRDTDDEKDLQVMTPTPTPSHPPQLNVVPPTNAAANPSIEQQAEVNVLQQPQPMPYVQYYYPSADCVDPNCYPAEMMPAQPIYQMQAPAYAAAPIPMQAAGPFGVPQAMPANHVYTMPMAATWPGQANPTAYYVAAPNPPMPVSIPTFAALPIRHRELLRCHGRVNFNPSPSVSPNGSDLPLGDKGTIRFYYNLGIEYFHQLQSMYGTSQLLAMFESENANSDVSSNDYDNSASFASDFQQQLNFDGNETDGNVPQTPHKERVPRYQHEGYFPGPTVNQNRRPNPNNYRKEPMKVNSGNNNNNKPNQRYNSYGSHAPKQTLNKNGPKNYQNGGHNSYDSTPIKDNGKPHYESSNNHNNGNTMNHHHHQGSGNNQQPAKREPMYATPEMPNAMLPPQPMPTHSPYLAPYVPYVPYDGNMEHAPMYMPMNVYPSPGIAQMQPLQPQPIHGPMPVASPIDHDMGETFHQSPVPGMNSPAYGFAPNYWGPAPMPMPQTHLVPVPQTSLNSSNVSSSSSNTTSAQSNPSQ